MKSNDDVRPSSEDAPRFSRRLIASAALGAGLVRASGQAQQTSLPFGVPRVSLPAIPENVLAGPAAAWTSLLHSSSLLKVSSQGELTGHLVTSWRLSEDRAVLDLRLRSDALFSDGSLIEPEDVVHSISRAREVAQTTLDAWRWEHLDTIELLDNDSIRLVLHQPDASVPTLLSTHRVPIVPKSWEWFATPAADGVFPAASGCFRVDYLTDNRIRFGRNNGFFQIGRPRLAGVLCTGPSGTVQRTTELVAGGVDLLIDAPLLDVPMLQEDPSIALVGGATNRLCLLSINLLRPIVGDRRVRRLVSSAINRQDLVEAATANEAVVATSLVPVSHFAGVEMPIDVADPGDVRSQLDALGVPPGIELRLVASDADASLANACVLLQEQLAWAGIALSLDLLSEAEMEAEKARGSWDMLMTYTENWRDPHELFRPLLTSDGVENVGGFSSDRVDYLVNLASRARDESYRGELYASVQQIVTDEVPLIPLFFPNYYDAMLTTLQNYPFYPPVSATAMSQVRMLKT